MVDYVETLSINTLYSDWLAASPESQPDKLLELLKDTRLYAVRILQKKYPALDVENLASDVMLSIGNTLAEAADIVESKKRLEAWFNVSWIYSFEARRFSTWAHSVVTNAAIDVIRRTDPYKEVALNERKDYGEKSGKRKTAIFSTDDSDDDFTSVGEQDVLSKRHLEATEASYNAQIDLELAVRRLSMSERHLLRLTRQGWKSHEVAEKLKLDISVVYARKAALRRIVGDLMYVDFGVLLHTCRLDSQTVYEEQVGEGRYIKFSDSSGVDSYQRLPDDCRCRKLLPSHEAENSLDEGMAQEVFQRVDGKIVTDGKAIWASQQRQVARIGLTSAVHVQRALSGNRQDQSDIEISHEISVESLKVLIMPFREDPWSGRPRFASFTEERTAGCFNDPNWQPDTGPRRMPAPVVLAEEVHCPSCLKDALSMAVFADGAVRESCRCEYLQVWRAKGNYFKKSHGTEIKTTLGYVLSSREKTSLADREPA